ncbi:MAG: hypothetical protein ACTSQJ_18940 [Promethearchaeota archaeon]
MVKDVLKFFQAFIQEMVDIGGENLPRTISTKLGMKLGKIYKERGLNTDFEKALSQIYIVIKGSPTITKIDDKTYEVNVKHSKRFCPIGGYPNKERAKLFQRNICIPYTLGFINEITSGYTAVLELKGCIVESHSKSCNYILKLTKKDNYSK